MIHVVGLGLEPAHVSAPYRRLIAEARVVGGGTRLLDALNIEPTRRLPLTTIEAFASRLHAFASSDTACVLADGDPLLFGIGASLLRFFPRHALAFHPNISAMQMLAARVGLPWHACAITSLHGRKDFSPVFAALTHFRLVAVYTDHHRTPAILAEVLHARGVNGWRLHVAEALGQSRERLFSGSVEDVRAQTWGPLTMVLLERVADPPLPLTLGLRTEDLARDQDLVTKQPVRAMIQSCLRLTPQSVLWDLGAGSGAVSLESATLIRDGRILAVERDARRVRDITVNIARTGAWMVDTRHDSIESFLATHAAAATDPSAPSHLFFGGGATPENLRMARTLLCPGGRMVIAAVLLSTLENARHALQDWPLTIHQLCHHHASPLGKDLRLVPSNPVFLLETQKPHA